MSFLMTDPVEGHVAVFDEAPGGGDPMDPEALCNRPLKDPVNWLTHLSYHSAFNLLELVSDTIAVVSHPGVAAAVATGGETDTSAAYNYTGGIINFPVLTHGLGYEPLVMVAVGSNILTPGYIVQANAGGAARYVSAYTTSTQVFLREVTARGNVALSALNQTYRILVFRDPREPVGELAMDIDPPNNVFRMGQGRFDVSRSYMQVRPGGSPFGLARGPTIDLNNGAPRFVSPSGSISNPIPSSLRLAMRVTSQPAVFGAPMNYGGSFFGSSAIQIQVP